MDSRSYVEIKDWALDYQTQLNATNQADLNEDQYSCIKNYYVSGESGLFIEVKNQILQRFTV